MIGPSATRIEYALLVGLAYGVPPAACMAGDFAVPVLLPLLSLPLAGACLRLVFHRFRPGPQRRPRADGHAGPRLQPAAGRRPGAVRNAMTGLADLATLQVVILGLILLAGGTVHGLLGFGFPLLATPLMAMLVDVRTAMLILLIPTLAINIASIVQGGHWKPVRDRTVLAPGPVRGRGQCRRHPPADRHRPGPLQTAARGRAALLSRHPAARPADALDPHPPPNGHGHLSAWRPACWPARSTPPYRP
jgi:hypothetical protein